MSPMLERFFHPRRVLLAVSLFALLWAPNLASAESLTLAWDANTEPDVIGYYVFIGTSSGVYSTTIDVGTATSYTFGSALPGTTYYLTVAAYSAGPVVGQRAPEVVTTTGGGPTLSNPGNQTGSRGSPVSLTLSATDPNGDTLTYGALGLPTGITVDSGTGVISGTPSVAGTYSVSVTAADPSANVTTQYFTWVIAAADLTPPTIAITNPTSAATYTTSSAFVTLSGLATDDVNLASVTWANNRGGSGNAAGTTSWSVVVPLQTGVNVVTMTALDGTAKSTSTTVTVTVDLAPTITISAPTTAASYTSNVATLGISGAASDDTSLASITWSNDRGGSGTATGTTSWSAGSIALQSGANVLSFVAHDGAGHTSTTSLTVTFAPSPLQLTSLTADQTAPQATGTTITFTAQASGGVGPYQYKWWLFNGSSWSVAQTWSSAASFTWTPSSANPGYKVGVWVRSGNRSADASDNDNSNRSVSFPITNPVSPLQVTSLTNDKHSPQTALTAIRFTAAATGGTAPYEFKWRVFDGTSWSVAQTWSNSAVYTWTPSTANAAYQVTVWARSAGSSTDAAETVNASATSAFVITPAAARLTLTALTADKTAPQPQSTTVTFTAAATGGTAPYQYKWWIFDGHSWTVAQSWSATSTFAWTPTRANNGYRVGVWVRSAGSSVDASDNDSANASVAFPIAAASAPLTLTTLTTNRTSPQQVSTGITFAAAAAGGTAPYSYKFRVFDGTAWVVGRDWSTTNTFVWTPATANGAYQVEVWARSSGNAVDAAENGNATATRAFA
ncbi:MAG: putative Ig domain-containing protein, partial [Vicinamibacterales bacterium]